LLTLSGKAFTGNILGEGTPRGSMVSSLYHEVNNVINRITMLSSMWTIVKLQYGAIAKNVEIKILIDYTYCDLNISWVELILYAYYGVNFIT
jgi:hypothetical protein